VSLSGRSRLVTARHARNIVPARVARHFSSHGRSKRWLERIMWSVVRRMNQSEAYSPTNSDDGRADADDYKKENQIVDAVEGVPRRRLENEPC